MTLESIYDSIFSLSNIFYMAPVAFQTIYKIVTLACAFGNCIVGSVVVQVFFIFPDWQLFAQYLQVLCLLQPLGVIFFGCVIFAPISMSFREGGFMYVIMKYCFPNSLVALDLPR